MLVRYTPRLADLMPGAVRPGAVLGAASWSAYIRFDHSDPVVGDLDLRLALAHAIDRDALAAACPANLVVATGGVVPPALQGHTPDIVPRYDPDLAREHLERSGFEGDLELAGMMVWDEILAVVTDGWRDVFGTRVSARSWSWQVEEALGRAPASTRPRCESRAGCRGMPTRSTSSACSSSRRAARTRAASPIRRFDELIERARQERSDRGRLERFHEADRYAVAERVAVIPLVYGRSTAFVQPYVDGWWEFGKTSASFADLTVERVR